MSSILTLLIYLLLFPSEHKDVFLNGNDSCSGMVGIDSGTKTYWLSGSNETWNRESANAVCQQMNCGTARNVSAIPSEQMKKDIWNVTYSCSNNTTSLFDCEKTSVPSKQRNTVATVTCSGKVTKSLQTHTAGFCGCLLSPSISSQVWDVVSSFLLWCPQQKASWWIWPTAAGGTSVCVWEAGVVVCVEIPGQTACLACCVKVWAVGDQSSTPPTNNTPKRCSSPASTPQHTRGV